MLYHGEQKEKWQHTFKMIDIEGKGAVKLPHFIEFWKQFVKMYGQALTTKIKFTDGMRVTFEQEFIIAAGTRDGVMTEEKFLKVKTQNPDYLSFIEDMEDGTFDGSSGVKVDENVSMDEFREYHAIVMKVLDNTSTGLKDKFALHNTNPITRMIIEKLKAQVD